jgi:tRNA 2-selenouridine synthase
VNIPLFSDEERAEVGTAYTRRSREAAVELGRQFVAPKLEEFVIGARSAAPDGAAAVHCWRGGMRSAAFADHLVANGFDGVLVIDGGYKAFRQAALEYFGLPFKLAILGGYTGSGKTDILPRLAAVGEQTVDLEALAHHKGSAFGSLGEEPQPRNEQFENDLYLAMRSLDLQRRIWLEDESANIGRVAVPKALFERMTSARLYFLDVPRDKRVRYLLSTYGDFDPADLAASAGMIAKRLGGERTARALDSLKAGELETFAEICLDYYDKAYERSMARRDPARVTVVKAADTDPASNASLLLPAAKGRTDND